MKKYFVVYILLVSLSSSAYSYTWKPPISQEELNVLLAYSIALPLYTAKCIYLYMKNQAAANVKPSGDISRPSEYVYVDLQTLPSVEPVKKPVTLEMNFDKAQSLSGKKKG